MHTTQIQQLELIKVEDNFTFRPLLVVSFTGFEDFREEPLAWTLILSFILFVSPSSSPKAVTFPLILPLPSSSRLVFFQLAGASTPSVERLFLLVVSLRRLPLFPLWDSAIESALEIQWLRLNSFLVGLVSNAGISSLEILLTLVDPSRRGRRQVKLRFFLTVLFIPPLASIVERHIRSFRS